MIFEWFYFKQCCIISPKENEYCIRNRINCRQNNIRCSRIAHRNLRVTINWLKYFRCPVWSFFQSFSFWFNEYTFDKLRFKKWTGSELNEERRKIVRLCLSTSTSIHLYGLFVRKCPPTHRRIEINDVLMEPIYFPFEMDTRAEKVKMKFCTLCQYVQMHPDGFETRSHACPSALDFKW